MVKDNKFIDNKSISHTSSFSRQENTFYSKEDIELWLVDKVLVLFLGVSVS